MSKLAIVGGTGLGTIDELKHIDQHMIETPYGDISAAIIEGELLGASVYFLARHGNPHKIPPHQVNYRANIFALKQLGITHIIAVHAVGGITEKMAPQVIVLPDNIIDYSYGRKHTYSDTAEDPLVHVDFSKPYSDALREVIKASSQKTGIDIVDFGIHGITQGPRLESAAEISRMRRDGCDIVGMTGMPEAGLARELGIDYASVCLVANWAAGTTDEKITEHDILENMTLSANRLVKLFTDVIPSL